jgi:hypothetical protein
MAVTAAIAPNPQAAPMVCPIIDLIELTGGGAGANTSWIARPSTRSLAGVPVPCAQT